MLIPVAKHNLVFFFAPLLGVTVFNRRQYKHEILVSKYDSLYRRPIVQDVTGALQMLRMMMMMMIYAVLFRCATEISLRRQGVQFDSAIKEPHLFIEFGHALKNIRI